MLCTARSGLPRRQYIEMSFPGTVRVLGRAPDHDASYVHRFVLDDGTGHDALDATP
jgi:hypothetical protein